MSKQPIALLFNDIHVSKDNISEFQNNWDEALSVCDKYSIGEIVIGGDLLHTRSSSQPLSVLMAVRQAIIKATNADIHLTIAEGNHDKVDQESILGYCHLFSEYPNVTVVDDYTVMQIGYHAELYVMSYFPEQGSFAKRLKKFEDDIVSEKVGNSSKADDVRVLYIHEGINGGLAQPSESELPTNIFCQFDSVLVGHYHDRKIIKNTHIEYIGASRQHNFGENEEKGYTLLYDDGSYEFVKNKVNIRYKTIDITFKSLTNNFIERLGEITSDGRYKVRTRINCTEKEKDLIDRQKLIDAGATKVEAVMEETEATSIASHSLEQKFDKDGIKQEYANFCADKGIKNVEMGLKYLDKIN